MFPPAPPSPVAPTRGRSIRPLLRPLPSGRAITGGVLVAIALLGTWYLGTGSGASPAPLYVTARHTLGPGHRVNSSDLRLVRVDLGRQLAATAFSVDEAPIGSVVARATASGELLTRSSVTSAPAGTRQVGLNVDPAWTLQDSLVPGSVVDVFVTYGEGLQATTRQVARSVLVADLSDRAGGGIGDEGGRQVTLQVARAQQLHALVHAAHAGSLTFSSTVPGHLTPRLKPYTTPAVSATYGEGP